MSGIKSDRWIRSQCISNQGQVPEDGFKPMIEPYERNQVRYRTLTAPGADGMLLGANKLSTLTGPAQKKIISYGTSSYGITALYASHYAFVLQPTQKRRK